MTALRQHLPQSVRRLWHTDAPLTATGLLMLGLLCGTLIGLWLDPRTIAGAPAWLKPAKFSLSIAVYTLTLAWVFGFLGAWRRMRRFVSLTTATVLIMEFAIIALQTWRGTTSHFNVGTPLDAALFGLMGAGIALQTLVSTAVAVALWRQSFDDPALGWALRLGMTISILGASTGGLMTAPTAAQLDAARTNGRLTIAGAHTVGAPDGGPGVPGTGWSREHGDIRVAHFVGLHALQALPLIALMLYRRRCSDSVRVRLTQVTGGGYGAFFALLLWQALRGQSVVAPDTVTIAAFATVSAATATALWRARMRGGEMGQSANAL